MDLEHIKVLLDAQMMIAPLALMVLGTLASGAMSEMSKSRDRANTPPEPGILPGQQQGTATPMSGESSAGQAMEGMANDTGMQQYMGAPMSGGQGVQPAPTVTNVPELGGDPGMSQGTGFLEQGPPDISQILGQGSIQNPQSVIGQNPGSVGAGAVPGMQMPEATAYNPQPQGSGMQDFMAGGGGALAGAAGGALMDAAVPDPVQARPGPMPGGPVSMPSSLDGMRQYLLQRLG